MAHTYFIIVQEWEATTPLIDIHDTEEKANASFDRRLLMNYKGRRLTLQQHTVDDFGSIYIGDLRTETFSYDLLAS